MMTNTLVSISNNRLPKASNIPLGQRLLQAGFITEQQLQQALTLQDDRGQRLGEILVAMGVISESDLLPLIGLQLEYPWVKLREGLVDPTVVKLIPREIAEECCCLALFRVHGQLTVAMSEPQNLEVVDLLEEQTGYTIRPVLSLSTSIERLLPRCYEEDFKVDALTADLDDSSIELDQIQSD